MLFLGFIYDEQHYGELVAYGDFPPFGALRHHLPPAVRWDYGCWAMCHIAQ